MPANKSATATVAKPGTAKKRVFLVDDHPIVRQGLAQLLNSEPDLEVCGQGEDTYQSLRAIREAKPDLCLVDVRTDRAKKYKTLRRRPVIFVAPPQTRPRCDFCTAGPAPRI